MRFIIKRPQPTLFGHAIGEILFDVFDEFFHGFGDVELTGIDLDRTGFGCLIGRGDACEVEDLTGPGATIQALGIAAFAHIKIGGDVNLVELIIADGIPGTFAVGPVRRDKGGQDNPAVLRAADRAAGGRVGSISSTGGQVRTVSSRFHSSV
jgi:hypothetical protein